MFTSWKLIPLLLGIAFFSPQFVEAQSDCGTIWYDNGGPNGVYLPNSNQTTTFCPDNDDDLVTVTFTSFNVETNWDKLYVYDGPNATSPQISSGNGIGNGTCTTTGGFWGTTIPGPFTSTDDTGCLTFVFCSDGSVELAGWAANVTCAPAPNCTPPVVSYVQNERDCEDLSYSVTVTIDEQSVPSSAPLLLATATANGQIIPEVGGVFNNLVGAELEIGPLPLDTPVLIEVNVLGFSCPTSESFTEVSNGCPIPLECGVAIEETYCYGDNENTPFLWVSPDGEPVTILFQSGLIATFGDAITIYDGADDTGEVLFTGANNGTLSGLSAVAESGSLYMVVTSNGFTSCANNGFGTSVWNWIVGCNLDIPGCTDADAVNFQPVATEDDGSCITGGTDCTEAIEVATLPYTSNANTNLFGNNYDAADLPPAAVDIKLNGAYSSSYLNGDDVVYAYTPAEDGFIDVSLTQTTTWVGLWVFEGCPFTLGVGAHTGSDANGRLVQALPVEAGTTYYVVISTFPAPQSTPYILNITNTVFDCVELNKFIGDACDNNGEVGQLDEDCECNEVVFDGCTGDFAAFAGLVPNCEGPTTVTNATFTNYHEVPVDNGTEYTFISNPFGIFQLVYITVTNQAGAEILATGANSVTWTSDFNGFIRFYTDGNADCASPGFFSHNRTVIANCENQVFDCPILGANEGEACALDGEFGIVEDCECLPVEFAGCTGGFLSGGNLNPNCDGTPALTTFSVGSGSYTTVNVFNGVDYVFDITDGPLSGPFMYLTITNFAGTEVLASGIQAINWTGDFNGQVRFYANSSPTCAFVTGTWNHFRRVTADCSNQIFDCPVEELNFNTVCPLENGDFGLISEDCVCAEPDFDGCTTGFAAFTVGLTNCDDTPFDINFVGVAQYSNVEVFNGVEYTFSHVNGPASAPFLYITITNGTGTEILATGISAVDWTSTYNGTARFYTHAAADCTTPGGTWTHTRRIEADCTNQIFDCPDLAANIGTTCDADGEEGIVLAECECVALVGTDCTNPFEFTTADLPFNLSGNTSVFGNNYTSADVPALAPGAIVNGGFSTVYLNGDDVVFEYTPEEDTFVDATVTEHGTWVGLWAFTGCPFASTVGVHTGSAGGDGRAINALPVTAGTTYYFVISTWPSPQSTNFNFTLSETVFDCPLLFANIGGGCDFNGGPGIVNADCECEELVGTDCTNPFNLTEADLPYSQSGNTATFGNNYTGADVPPVAPNVIGNTATPATFYLSGPDAVFMYTPENDGFIDVEITGTTTGGGLFVFTGCPFATTVGFNTAFGAIPKAVNALPVNAGVSYYVVVSSSSAATPTAFTLTIEQTVFDCPEENANIGGFCLLESGAPGELDADCACIEIEFDGCDELEFAAFGDLIPACGQAVTATNATFTNYHVVPVQNGGSYAFSAGAVTGFPFQFLTVTNADGTVILASGIQSLTWLSDFNGNIRFYSDANADCTSPGFFSHSRTVTTDCSDVIYDCPEENLNIGDVCTPDGGGFGTLNEDCVCDEIIYTGCLTGVPFGNITVNCAIPSGSQGGIWFGEYVEVNVTSGVDYTFATSPLPAYPLFYLTVSNGAGTTVLATGLNSLEWTSNVTGVVRFNAHASADCPAGTIIASHTRIVTADCSAEPSIWEVIQDSEVHTTLEAAVIAAELDDDLEGEGPFTVMAPTDAAFDALEEGVLDALLDNTELLASILLYHAAEGAVLSDDLTDGQVITTLAGLPVTITINDDGIFVNDAEIIVADITASNGIVHVIDAVLIPDTELVGTDCTNPFALTTADLPYTQSGNTATFGNNYVAADVPALATGAITNGSFTTSYLNGDDVVFEFTPDEDTFVDVEVSGHDTWVGLWAFEGCPFASTVGYHTASSSTGRLIPQLPVSAGTTYYFVISTWPTPNSTDFVINISETEFDCPTEFVNFGEPCDFNGEPGIIGNDCTCGELVGTDCTNPFVIVQAELPYNQSGNTATFGDNYSSTDVPANAPNVIGTGSTSASYLNGDDVVFEFTPDTDTFVDVAVTDHGTWVGLWAFEGCPFESTVGYHNDSPLNTGRFINALPVEAGTTYYFVISTFPSPQSTTFNLTVSETVFDCPDLNANIGDPCDFNGGDGSVSDDCECEELVGTDCTNPFVLTTADLPYNLSGNTSTFGDNYDNPAPALAANAVGTGTFSAFYLSGDDVVFEYTPEDDTFVDASVTDHGSWVGLYAFVGCPFTSTVGYHTVSTANTGRFIDAMPVTGGTTYYFVISTNATPQSTTFNFSLSETVFDCPDENANIGDLCETIDGDFGLLNDDCGCDAIVYEGCTNGTSFGSPNPTCENPVATVTNSWNNEYSTVTVFDGGIYTFSTSFNANVPIFFVTITNSTGTEILATGLNTLTWESDIDGTVRMYTHGSADCAGVTGSASSHTRTFTVECPADANIWDIVQDSEVHNTLEAAVLAAGLDEALSGEGPFTVFAPTDDAFDALEEGVLDALLDDPEGLLTTILLYHVAAGEVLSTDLTDGQIITTLAGFTVTITINDDGVFVNDAQVIVADIIASNGIVHVIDAVLIPEPTECDEATPIIAAVTFNESSVSASMLDETASGVEQCQNTSNVQPDQWFSFESVATVMYVRAWGLGDFNAAVEVYDACGGELIACQNDAPAGQREIVILQNTTPGETYYVRVYHGGAGTPQTLNYTVAVAHIPFIKLEADDCGVFDYTPTDVISSELPSNQFLLTNYYFEFTELEEPFNTYEILSPNGSNRNFQLQWFPQAEFGRTYSVRTRARMYQGPNWGDYGDACTIGFADGGATTQLKVEFALGFYNMCDILEADNVAGASEYTWLFTDGFDSLTAVSPNRFLQLQNVEDLNLGSPYAVSVKAQSLGQYGEYGISRLIAMNNFVPTIGLDENFTACGSTVALNAVISAINICAADYYTFRFTNISDLTQEDLFYTRDDGLRTVLLSWVTGLIPGDTYAVQVLGASGGLVGTYGPICEITIAGGMSGIITLDESNVQSDVQAEISIYPNPSRGDEVMVSIENLQDVQNDVIIDVYDMYGKRVHSENYANNGTFMNVALDFQQPMAAGVYLVNITSNSELIGARKLIVQK